MNNANSEVLLVIEKILKLVDGEIERAKKENQPMRILSALRGIKRAVEGITKN